jgi:hypothetical protein
LVLVIGLRGSLAYRFIVIPRYPTIEGGLQRVGFGCHEACRPKQRLRARFPNVRREICLTGAGQDNGAPWFASLDSNNRRNLKIHEGVVTYVNIQISPAADGKGLFRGIRLDGDIF